jgi:hypothetical protein
MMPSLLNYKMLTILLSGIRKSSHEFLNSKYFSCVRLVTKPRLEDADDLGLRLSE